MLAGLKGNTNPTYSRKLKAFVIGHSMVKGARDRLVAQARKADLATQTGNFAPMERRIPKLWRLDQLYFSIHMEYVP